MEPSTGTEEAAFNVHKPAYLETTEQIKLSVESFQAGQSQLLPSSIGKQALGNVVTASHKDGQALLFSTSINDATTKIVRVEVRDDYGRTFLPAPQVAIYPGYSSTAGTLPQAGAWPNANFAMNNFPCSIIPLDLAYSDDTHAVTTLAIRNNSGAAVPLVIGLRWILIVNSAATIERNDSTSV